jgi:hypothetical protein
MRLKLLTAAIMLATACEAAQPAIVKPFGIPSSRREMCAQLAAQVRMIVGWDEQGVTMDDIVNHIVAILGEDERPYVKMKMEEIFTERNEKKWTAEEIGKVEELKCLGLSQF